MEAKENSGLPSPPLQYRNFLSDLNSESSCQIVSERKAAYRLPLGADHNFHGSSSSTPSCEIHDNNNTRIGRLPKLTLCTGQESESGSETAGGSNLRPALLLKDCSVPSPSHSCGTESEVCSGGAGDVEAESSRRANLITFLPETPSHLNTSSSTPSSLLSPSALCNPSLQWNNAHLQNSTLVNPFLQQLSPTSPSRVLPQQPHQNPSLQLFPLCQNNVRQVLFPHVENPAAPLLHHHHQNPHGVVSPPPPPQVPTVGNPSLIPSSSYYYYSDSNQSSTWSSNEMSETDSTARFKQIWPYYNEDSNKLLQQQQQSLAEEECKGATRSLSHDVHDDDGARCNRRRIIDLNHLEQFHGASSEPVVLTTDDSNTILWANAAFAKASSEKTSNRMQVHMLAQNILLGFCLVKEGSK